jgi:LuxR family transcriptional regulator, quorum-sensing system regulator BjaR1
MSPLDSVALDFIFRIRECRDERAFAFDLARAIDQFGLDRYAIGTLAIAGEAFKRNITRSTYPKEWAERYHPCGYEKSDPVIRHLQGAVKPKIWSELPTEKGSLAWRIMHEARDLGLRDGIAVPIVTGRGLRAYANFATSTGDFRRDAAPALNLIGIFAHHAIQSISDEKSTVPRAPTLTSREHECLKWLAEGKSHWETGEILSISARTVKFHLHSVAMKLGTRAVSAQIVAEAFRRSLIS